MGLKFIHISTRTPDPENSNQDISLINIWHKYKWKHAASSSKQVDIDANYQ